MYVRAPGNTRLHWLDAPGVHDLPFSLREEERDGRSDCIGTCEAQGWRALSSESWSSVCLFTAGHPAIRRGASVAAVGAGAVLVQHRRKFHSHLPPEDHYTLSRTARRHESIRGSGPVRPAHLVQGPHGVSLSGAHKPQMAVDSPGLGSTPQVAVQHVAVSPYCDFWPVSILGSWLW